MRNEIQLALNYLAYGGSESQLVLVNPGLTASVHVSFVFFQGFMLCLAFSAGNSNAHIKN